MIEHELLRLRGGPRDRGARSRASTAARSWMLEPAFSAARAAPGFSRGQLASWLACVMLMVMLSSRRHVNTKTQTDASRQTPPAARGRFLFARQRHGPRARPRRPPLRALAPRGSCCVLQPAAPEGSSLHLHLHLLPARTSRHA